MSIQNQITKQQAKALLYYQQHGFSSIDDFDAFSDSVADAKKRRDELSTKITSSEKRMKEIAVPQGAAGRVCKAVFRKKGGIRRILQGQE